MFAHLMNGNYIMKMRKFEIPDQVKTYYNPMTDQAYSALPCGLFRANLMIEADALLPELKQYYTSAFWMLVNEGHEPEEWEIDVKIHMLMKDQYPCIPNWHCDNVPRNSEGKLDYSAADTGIPMYLLVTGNPTTEFVSSDTDFDADFVDHADVANRINTGNVKTLTVPEDTWVKFYQNTPHRGTKATEKCWRIFIRLSHKSILPLRKTISPIRRHCQVYLDASQFSW